MKIIVQKAFGVTIVTAVALLFLCRAGQPAMAQTAESSLKESCTDAARAFALRQAASEALVVDDPAAPGKLRQAALLFYRCAERESDPYMHQLFLAYYANTLYKVAQNTGDDRAASLAATTARQLSSSQFDDVRALVARINPPNPIKAEPGPTATPAPVGHSVSYCRDLEPSVEETLEALNNAIIMDVDAGNTDTQVLAGTTARYGGAFKRVEDDFNSVQGSLQSADTSLGSATAATDGLNDHEKPAVNNTLSVLGATIRYADTYSRLALGFERGINGANRQIARAQIAQALASGQHNTAYTYTNGNTSCYSSSAYTANCYGNSYSNTTYNNSATVAQQNAANALAAAQAGRLSYAQADAALADGLTVLQQIQGAVLAGAQSWHKACD